MSSEAFFNLKEREAKFVVSEVSVNTFLKVTVLIDGIVRGCDVLEE